METAHGGLSGCCQRAALEALHVIGSPKAPEDALESPQVVCMLVIAMPDSNSLCRLMAESGPVTKEASMSPKPGSRVEPLRQERSRCFWVNKLPEAQMF